MQFDPGHSIHPAIGSINYRSGNSSEWRLFSLINKRCFLRYRVSWQLPHNHRSTNSAKEETDTQPSMLFIAAAVFFFIMSECWDSYKQKEMLTTCPALWCNVGWTVPDALTSVLLYHFITVVWSKQQLHSYPYSDGLPPAVSASSALDVHVLHI